MGSGFTVFSRFAVIRGVQGSGITLPGLPGFGIRVEGSGFRALECF